MREEDRGREQANAHALDEAENGGHDSYGYGDARKSGAEGAPGVFLVAAGWGLGGGNTISADTSLEIARFSVKIQTHLYPVVH